MNELERDIGVCYARTGMSLEALKELVEKLFNQEDPRLNEALNLVTESFHDWNLRGLKRR